MSGFIRSTRIACIAVIIMSGSSVMARASDTLNRVAPNLVTPAADSACSLLTKEAAAATLGESVNGPKAKSMAHPGGPIETVSSCEYTGSGYHRIQLNLSRLSQSAAPMFRSMCKEKATKDLAGLGEVACWYNEKHQELHAFKGLDFLSIEITTSGDPTEAAKGAMKKALERLK